MLNKYFKYKVFFNGTKVSISSPSSNITYSITGKKLEIIRKRIREINAICRMIEFYGEETLSLSLQYVMIFSKFARKEKNV